MSINIDNKFVTEQEAFWAGEFGNDYINRNDSELLVAANIDFFSTSLKSVGKINNCLEFGANVGMNLKAMKLLYPFISCSAIEINQQACKQLQNFIEPDSIYNESIIDFSPSKKWDLVLIKGVLIHINPDYLDKVYQNLVNSTEKYLMIAEYYNPTPVTIPYRGHDERMYKRDFAGELLDKHPNFELVDYGFTYHRDNKYKHDDINWFLMQVAK